MTITSRMRRIAGLAPGEGVPVCLATLLFFVLMTGYAILKPLRDEMGIAAGVDSLPHLYLATLATMVAAAPLFGWLARRRRREVFLPVTYQFFAANLLLFYGLLRWWPTAETVVGRMFYVWVSVFNLFALSLFWGFMADGFGLTRSRRTFGVLAVGGTAGAVLGSTITAALVQLVGRLPLLLVSVVCLETAVVLVRILHRRFVALDATDAAPSEPPGHALDGIRLTFTSPYLIAVSAFLILYSLTSTLVYLEQAHIVAAAEHGRAARAALLARIEVWVQGVTLATQLLGTSRVLRWLGTGLTLALLPMVTGLGFLALGLRPTLTMLIAFQVVRRATNYALVKPARETLFAPLARVAKYRAKTFIDTFVYRGGDALGAALFDRLAARGLGPGGVAVVAAALTVAWAAVAVHLGRRQAALA